MTIHKVTNGTYTAEWLALPHGGYFSYATCRVVNHELHWSVYADTFNYRKNTQSNGTPVSVTNGIIAIYEYIGTELQKLMILQAAYHRYMIVFGMTLMLLGRAVTYR